MAFKVHVREEAKADISKAAHWYETRQEGLGEEFLSVVERQLKYLSDFPESFLIKKGVFRELVIREFPYVMIYTSEGSEVIVFAVFNTSRDQNKKP